MHCLNCGKPIRKWTETVNADCAPGSLVPVKGWTYTGNKQIVSQRYILIDPVEGDYVGGYVKFDDPVRWARRERRLCSVNVWDGESYLPSGQFFCSGPCVTEFAIAAVEAGFRRT